MKLLVLTFLILEFTFCGCYCQNRITNDAGKSSGLGTQEILKSKNEIQNLIRQVLIWSESKESIELLPAIKDRKDSAYVGFEMNKLKINLDKLAQTGFFATEFIENYCQIIRTIDKKIRNKELEAWLVGDLPPFNFVNGINPWCQCQGFSQNDFDKVEIIKLDNKSGELKWIWKAGLSWTNFYFRVVKDDNKWKITYMEGFDFKESTK